MKGFVIYRFKIGYIRLEYIGAALCSLSVINNEPTDFGVETEFTKNVHKQLTQYFSGERVDFCVALNIETTPFRTKVMEALKSIPYGETRTYKQVAETIGMPKGARAVGGACNKNPIQIIIPCHRVVGTNGKLIGYAGGLEIKSALLNLENGIKIVMS